MPCGHTDICGFINHYVGHVNYEQDGSDGNKEEGAKKEKTYGIKHWSWVRSIPRIHTQIIKAFQQTSIG
eukprot:6180132-Pleurochrysis_carterae.AAC.3